MGLEVYYFSGTGNSLAVARNIAGQAGGTLISLPSVTDQPEIKTEAEAVGIVFPSYLAQLNGVPLIVERFVRKLEDPGSKYIFAVCTCGGLPAFNALPTLKNLDRGIKARGGALSAAFSVKLPMNNLDYPLFVNSNRERMFQRANAKIPAICRDVSKRKKRKYGVFPSLLNLLMTPLYRRMSGVYIKHLKKMAKEPADTRLRYHELIPLTDRSICADGNCNGCAVCAGVCPVRNIRMIEERPVWRHRCEMCLACAAWCPRRAVHHWNLEGGREYHHPEVSLSDMITANRRKREDP